MGLAIGLIVFALALIFCGPAWAVRLGHIAIRALRAARRVDQPLPEATIHAEK